MDDEDYSRALAEARARTVIDKEGRELPGTHAVDTIASRIVRETRAAAGSE